MNSFIQAVAGAMCVLRPNVWLGKRLAIIGSTDVDEGFYAAFAASGQALGAETTIGLMTPRTAFGREAPEAINRHVMGADVVVAAPSTSISHSDTCLAHLKAGGRWLSIPAPKGAGRAMEMLAGFASYDEGKLRELKEITLRGARLLTQADRARVTSDKGSELTVSIAGRRACAYYGIAESESEMQGSWPPSETHIAAVEDSADGIFVVDGYVTGVGTCDVPVRIKVRGGRISSIEGGTVARRVEKLVEESDSGANVLCEIGMGTNRYQREEGNNGDKKVVGTVHLAVGMNAAPSFGINYDGKNRSNLHLDFVLKAPVTLELDGVPVVTSGELRV
jgi:leucyl aminopeptidase (aminopeptidase T)